MKPTVAARITKVIWGIAALTAAVLVLSHFIFPESMSWKAMLLYCIFVGLGALVVPFCFCGSLKDEFPRASRIYQKIADDFSAAIRFSSLPGDGGEGDPKTLQEARARKKKREAEITHLKKKLEKAESRLKEASKSTIEHGLIDAEISSLESKMLAKRHEVIEAEAAVEQLEAAEVNEEKKEVAAKDAKKPKHRKQHETSFSAALRNCLKKGETNKVKACAKEKYDAWLEVNKETAPDEATRKEIEGRYRRQYQDFLLQLDAAKITRNKNREPSV